MQDRVLSRRFLTLCVAFFFVLLNIGLSALIPYYLELRNAGELFYGAAAGMHGVGGVLGMLVVGGQADRGSRRAAVLRCGISLLAGNVLALVAMDWSPVYYLVALALQGAMLGVALPLMFVWASELCPPERRTEAFAWFGVAGLVADSLGPLLGEALLFMHSAEPTADDFYSVFLAANLLVPPAAVCLWLTPTVWPAAVEGGASTGGLGPLVRTRHVRFGLLAAAMFGGALGVLVGLGKNFAASIGLAFVSVLYGGHTAGAIAARLVLPFILLRTQASQLPPVAFCGLVASMLLLAATTNYGLLVSAGLVYGLSHGLLFPTLLSRLIDYGGKAASGRLSTLYMGAFSLGQGVLPLVGGVVLEFTSFRVLFLGLAVTSSAGLWFIRRAEHFFREQAPVCLPLAGKERVGEGSG